MPETFRTTRRVEFCQTDAAGIMHFSQFFLMMEQAEHELLRHLGTSVVCPHPEGSLSWPRVAAGCQFRDAVRFEELLDIDVTVDRLGDTSVTYRFRFSHAAREVAEGYLTAVCCRMVPGQRPLPTAIPGELRERLARYLQPSPTP
jgi:acyl-CoA thioester hydrolase